MSADLLHLEIADVELVHLDAVRTAPGVKLLLIAARNGPGTAWLRASGDGSDLAWKAPGSSSYGEDVACAADGEYLIKDGDDTNKFARVQVWRDFLVSPGEYPIYLRDRYNNGVALDDVTAEQAASGDVSVSTITLHNVSSSEMTGVVVWVDSDTAAPIEISTNGTNWFRPENEEVAVALPSIPAESTVMIYVKRTIVAGTENNPKMQVHFHVTFYC